MLCCDNSAEFKLYNANISILYGTETVSEQVLANHGSHVAMVADFASHPVVTVAAMFFLETTKSQAAYGKPQK